MAGPYPGASWIACRLMWQCFLSLSAATSCHVISCVKAIKPRLPLRRHSELALILGGIKPLASIVICYCDDNDRIVEPDRPKVS
jgi:hypothetical protein